MSRIFITTIMTFAFLLGGVVADAQASGAETYAKEKKPCDKCKKAGKKDCDCGKKKSEVEELGCGKCGKSGDCGKKDCKGCKGCKDCKKKDCNKKDCKDCPHKKTCGCKKGK